MKKLVWIIIFIIGFSFFVAEVSFAKTTYQKEDVARYALYHKMEALTSIPWYYLAAIDQYERSIRRAQKDRPEEEGLIGIYYSPLQWVGPLNPNLDDKNANTISLFGGVGLDGNNDGIADRNNDEDILYTFAHYLQSYGFDEENVKIGLWDYYQRDKTVDIIMGIAKVYNEYQTLSLHDRAFPVPIRSNYSYRSTWGDRRGFGGLRIHEGTDIFANYSVPVRATTYGVVEMKGWNRFGGWRVGIRDLNNVYHYYAHLNGFEKGIEKGSVVKPGQTIGYVGSSGYGPPGTQGKFPPHLHYGMYRDNGYSEWSFDPYPYLRAWERQERTNNRKK
ncbi:M23 family metallopeptidase [Pseudalkalibacillus sp. SCS-8]|uniref:M23 family metallopeptidase n=1 Tax=Pseudalkalibacillus nanhaiensis TaxID=3115291 RepID=UPI0032DACFC3